MVELFARWGHNVLLAAMAFLTVAVLVAAR
jgi:hypothetical protein